ncbi:cilia- and flagella-associated protein 337 isoform X2 [Hydra vulgaris]|uniref:Cilia- and flagella-associated protein 337 isoform X2 n=1 Tax=Hydra vulgaris TaxID=6087 RepID=A0ABM4CSX0_HYDVU
MTSSKSLSSFLQSLEAKDLYTVFNLFKEKSIFVNREMFCELLSKTLTKGDETDYQRLFDSVDSIKSGQLSWDSLCNYLLLKYYEQDELRSAIQIPEWKTAEFVPIFHKKSICRILECQHSYVVVSTDGQLTFLNNDLKTNHTVKLKTGVNEEKLKNLWVTDAIFIESISKFVFSSTKKELYFYDITTPKLSYCQGKFHNLNAVPLCLTSRSDENQTRSFVIAYGDTNGTVYIIYFSSYAIFQNKRDCEIKNNVFTINDIINGAVSCVSCIKYDAHSNWVSSVMHVSYLNCVVSCSASKADSLTLAWLAKKDKKVKLTKFSVSLGINELDYHKKLNIIASAGIDTTICLWNPYHANKPVGVLRAHRCVVAGVKFIVDSFQLLSLSKDSVLCLWDVNLQHCLQKLFCVFPTDPDVNITMHFSMENFYLFVSINNQLSILKAVKKSFKTTHKKPIKDVIYNSKYDYAISVCEESNIIIWLLSTGQKFRTLLNPHEGTEITSMVLSDDNDRLLTASINGRIKIWDMNEFYSTDLNVGNFSVNFVDWHLSKLMFLKKMIIVISSNSNLWSIPFSANNNCYCQPVIWKVRPEHSNEITAAFVQEPNYLVTGSYNGIILVWDTNIQNVLTMLTATKNPNAPESYFHTLFKNSENNTFKNGFIKLPVLNDCNTTLLKNSNTNYTKASAENVPEQNEKIQHCDQTVSVTSIVFLNSDIKEGLDLPDFYTCHYDGTVIFWNSSFRVYDFKAFELYGHFVSDIDSTNSFFCIGSKNGTCKIWNLSKCFINENFPIKEPELVSYFTPHNDQVSVVRFTEKNNLILILSASDDCTVALHYFDKLIDVCNFVLVGVFGQDSNWNIDTFKLKEPFFEKNTTEIEIKEVNMTKNPKATNSTAYNSSTIIQNLKTNSDNTFKENSYLVSSTEKKVKENLASTKNIYLKQKQSFKNSVENGTLYKCLHTYNIMEINSLCKPNNFVNSKNDATRISQNVILPHLDNLSKTKIRFNEAMLFPPLNAVPLPPLSNNSTLFHPLNNNAIVATPFNNAKIN